MYTSAYGGSGGSGIHNLLTEEVLWSCQMSVEIVRILQELREEFNTCSEPCDCSPPDNLNIDTIRLLRRDDMFRR